VACFLISGTRIIVCVLVFFSGSFLSAALVDWLKKAEGKSTVHGMKNIDFIYMINLDKRPEKYFQASMELQRYGIFPYRFSAVNGWELPLQAINDVGCKYFPGMKQLFATAYPIEFGGEPLHEHMSEIGRAYFTHGLSKGAIGCALSHISVLKDAWDSGYETIWVLEDDITSLQDPRILSDLIARLDDVVGKKKWDVLLTDLDYRTADQKYLIASGASERPDMDCSIEARYSPHYTRKIQVSPDFQKISARFATHSMIIRRSGIAKLLQWSLAHHIFLPYDLENYLPPGINRYSLTYDVVSNAINSITDNAQPNYN
jgi:GR25 family glycosyltransferase involved in LPS biosynthesis